MHVRQQKTKEKQSDTAKALFSTTLRMVPASNMYTLAVSFLMDRKNLI